MISLTSCDLIQDIEILQTPNDAYVNADLSRITFYHENCTIKLPALGSNNKVTTVLDNVRFITPDHKTCNSKRPQHASTSCTNQFKYMYTIQNKGHSERKSHFKKRRLRNVMSGLRRIG